MKEILIFAGTTEGRKLSELLAATGIRHTVSVATEYGEMCMQENPFVNLHRGRMDQDAMVRFLSDEKFSVVVDATHPYANIVTENIKNAAKTADVPYIRLKRDLGEKEGNENFRLFENHEACAKALEEVDGNILLTTGSKDLAVYCASDTLRDRLYVRVLPGVESVELCMKQGLRGKQILALQGPFSVELNEALIRQFHISCMVTKQSGAAGGFPEKMMAARNTGIPVFAVGMKVEDTGESFFEVCQKLETLTGIKLQNSPRYHITLVGIGMGSETCLTKEASDAIRNADLLFGAERMIRPWEPRIEKKPFYRASEILPYLENFQEKECFYDEIQVAVLLSGDTGFYSGCKGLYRALKDAIQDGKLTADVTILPGISSVSYLSSCIGESYQDTPVYSIHGKILTNLARRIACTERMFLLMSGAEGLRNLGSLLKDAGLDQVEITAGFQLSYPEEKIMHLSPEECRNITQDGLYTCFLKNPHVKPAPVTHGKSDSEFIRDQVPMTKEEIREVSICKMHLKKDSVVYDIGSGTGSIAVEIAGLSDDIQVYAIERKKEAVSLIHKNKDKFHLENISVIEAEAPDKLDLLPVPTHAFIGGSGKKMCEILQVLYHKNPQMRIVLNAVSLETLAEVKEILNSYPIENEEIVQMQVSRAKKVASYHMMQAENPIWIFAFNFKEVTNMEKGIDCSNEA